RKAGRRFRWQRSRHARRGKYPSDSFHKAPAPPRADSSLPRQSAWREGGRHAVPAGRRAAGMVPRAAGSTLPAMDLLRWRRGQKSNGPAAESGAEGQLPSRINHYRIRGSLGQGGMGVVYLAEDERLGRDVALKVLRDNSTDQSARLRLVREARIAAGISHPLICQVFELGEWNDQPFIAMELIDGEPLAARLANGPLPAADALRIAAAVVEALGVLHRRGIIHRDL